MEDYCVNHYGMKLEKLIPLKSGFPSDYDMKSDYHDAPNEFY